jgi:ribosome maturation factor RimP
MGPTAHFFLELSVMDVVALLERTLPGLGYEFVDAELSPRGRTIRVFIDKPAGVDVEDCALVSNHLSRLFSVENIDYDRLEVSSPGLDRPLRKPEDFVRFAGSEIKLRLRVEADGQRRFSGVLKGMDAGKVLLETSQQLMSLPFEHIEQAHLVPKIDWRKR